MKLGPYRFPPVRTFRRKPFEDRYGAIAWTSEEVFSSGQAYFASLFLALQHAQQSIWIEAYILRDDAVGLKVLELLEAAHARGLDVRLHIDGFGSQEWLHRRSAVRTWPSFPIRVFNPVNTWKVLRNLGTLNFRNFVKEVRRLNRRTHRKLALIDGMVAYVGSMNLCAEPVEAVQGARAWRDTAVRVQGPGLEILIRTFDRVWQGAIRRSSPDAAAWAPILRDNSTARQRLINHRRLLREIGNARTRILVTSAYFVPVRTLRRELRRAAKRGVDVRIIVPGCSDVFFLPWVSRQFFKRLMDAGVSIFEYQDRMIHAKTMIIDGTAWVGSSNLNGRSLYWDLELDVRVTKPESVHALTRQFESDQEQSVSYVPRALGPWLGIPRLIGYLLLKLSRHL